MRVLIFETHPYHYEIIPGFVSLFLQLGCQVDCLLQEAGDYGDVFCRCEELRKQIQVYHYTDHNLTEVLQALQKKYDLIFFSSIDMDDDICQTALSEIENRFDPKPKLAGCCHAFNLADDVINEMILRFEGRIVALSTTETSCGTFPEVNPNYFCETEKYGEKHDKTKIIGIGESVNPKELIRATDTVHLTLVKKASGFFDSVGHIVKYAAIRLFRLKKYDLTHHILFRIPKNREIAVTGRVSFRDLYSLVEASDFIVINVFESRLKEFSSMRTTGSKQLSLGFLKPCILEKSLADYYGFSEKNAIVFHRGELTQAVERAASMTKEQYAKMAEELAGLREQIRKSSLINLERIVSD